MYTIRKLMNHAFMLNLQLFAEPNTQTTTRGDLSPEMKVYYSDYLIDNATPKLVHDQFGQKHPIPKNGGKTIEFRKFSPLPKALQPLTEGVTPDGQSLTVTTIEATVKQYGNYVTLSDVLMLTSIDPMLVQATKLLGNQAGATLDTITREVLNGGTNVQYAEGQVTGRHLLVGGRAEGNHTLTVNAIKRAVRTLKVQNADKIGDSYIAIIHPDCTYDLTSDPEWQRVKDYDPEDWYEGEIGRIGGVRFIETTEAKIFKGGPLTAGSTNLTLKGTSSSANSMVMVAEAVTAADAAAIKGRYVLLNGVRYKILSAIAGSAGTAALTLDGEVTQQNGDILYPGEGGADGRAVYSTLVLADNAYGVTEVTGGGLQHIVKQLGSAGTADPLNQRATAGWKAIKTAVRLVEQFMVRIETVSSFDSSENN